MLVRLRNSLIIVLILISTLTFAGNIRSEINRSNGGLFDIASVIRKIDGDTLYVVINGNERYVRLLGVDTSECVKPGVPIQEGSIEASEFTKQLEGRTVILTYSDKKEDFFGRILAYVWLPTKNGELICWNLELIKEGHSDIYTKYKFSGLEWFKERLNYE